MVSRATIATVVMRSIALFQTVYIYIIFQKHLCVCNLAWSSVLTPLHHPADEVEGSQQTGEQHTSLS